MTNKEVTQALSILKGAVMIVYPMGLPPYDPIQQEFDNVEDLSGTQVRAGQFVAHLWSQFTCVHIC